MKGIRNFVCVKILTVTLIICLHQAGFIRAHCYLKEPYGRASLWRDSRFPTAEKNYDDNAYNCGGRGEKCGPCGNNIKDSKPRSVENTGQYGKGLIAREFECGKNYDFTVTFTATHAGFFGFKWYCLQNSSQVDPDDPQVWRPLKSSDGLETFPLSSFPLNGRTGDYTMNIKIPEDSECNRAVIQMDYTGGNDWGDCGDGTGAVGCGDQEHFMSCSDVIFKSPPTNTTTTSPSPSP